jgi:hypothetical protein
MKPFAAILTDPSTIDAATEGEVFRILMRISDGGADRGRLPTSVADWLLTQFVGGAPLLDRFALFRDHLSDGASAWERYGEADAARALREAIVARDRAEEARGTDDRNLLRAATKAYTTALTTAEAVLAPLASFHVARLVQDVEAFREVDSDEVIIPIVSRFHTSTSGGSTDAANLLLADAAAPVDDGELEDAVWSALCDRVDEHRLEVAPPEVGDWYLTRLLLWDSMNGGAAQSAYNYGPNLGDVVAAWRRAGQDAVADIYAAIDNRRAAKPASPSETAGRIVVVGDPLNEYVAMLPDYEDLDEPLIAALRPVEDLHIGWLRREREAFLLFLQR